MASRNRTGWELGGGSRCRGDDELEQRSGHGVGQGRGGAGERLRHGDGAAPMSVAWLGKRRRPGKGAAAREGGSGNEQARQRE